MSSNPANQIYGLVNNKKAKSMSRLLVPTVKHYWATSAVASLCCISKVGSQQQIHGSYTTTHAGHSLASCRDAQVLVMPSDAQSNRHIKQVYCGCTPSSSCNKSRSLGSTPV